MTASSARSRRSIQDICAELGIEQSLSSSSDDWYSTCPMCSQLRRTGAHRKSKVLHVHVDADGLRGYCNHCDWSFGEYFEPKGGRAAITAIYNYADERGDLLYQVVRFHPKDFRQRRPDGRGGWIWNMHGARRVLFRLPELIAAKANGTKVAWITEGEKDVLTLTKHGESYGAVATCNAGGADKWREEYSESLCGFEYALIIADKDAPGRQHAETVAQSCAGTIPHVRIIEVPGDGKDVSDFFAAGGTYEELAELARKAPDWMPGTAPTAPRDAANGAVSPPFPQMDQAAYCGLAGDVVNAIAPHTESDPVALLLQILTYFGNIIGRTAYYQVEADRHHGNIFVTLVGDTAKARKGTSGSRIRALFEEVSRITADIWIDDRVKGGLSSGEGLIYAVRDAVEGWNKSEQSQETVDPGAADKRLLIDEREFASALAVMDRQESTLSPIIRHAWDGVRLGTLTKNSPLKATGAHISIIGHITEEELRGRLTRTDAASGFGNRFLFACVRRSKLLPFGGEALDAATLHALGERLAKAIAAARKLGRVQMTNPARGIWEAIYAELSVAQPGLLGAIVARAEAQVVRLALLYALIDGRDEIDVDHLKAAIAVWEYAEASAVRIFGDSLGDPVADEVLRALRQAGAAGMSRTAISDLFGRNKSGERIGAALGLLASKGRARTEQHQTSGRSVEMWFAINRGG